MAKSHPTYNVFGKHMGTIEERCKKANLPDAWSSEGMELREDFAKEHGRGWWVFDYYEKVAAFKQRPWIENYMIKERSK